MEKLNNESLIQWFVGFSDAEGCFKIKPRKRNGKIISFGFEFEIHLHSDDFELLKSIKEGLNIGNTYLYSQRNSCSFVVASNMELKNLINIFDSFPLNGAKYLDYLDFKEAFQLYFSRTDTISPDLINKLLKIKEGINKGRSADQTVMPKEHKINITGYWLAGLIDGEGSFSMTRGRQLRLCFQLLFTASQKPLLEAIKTFLVNNLELDEFSLWKIANSSIIGIFEIKAKGNSKPTVCLEIRNISFLHNCFIPFLSNFPLLSKKSLDFSDFILICQAIYRGGHKDDLIRELLVRLSLRMNDYRLSTFEGESKSSLSSEEFAKLLAASTVPSLDQVKDMVYQIKQGETSKELIVDSLKEASEVVGLHYSKLSKLLDGAPSTEVEFNNWTIKRILVFSGR